MTAIINCGRKLGCSKLRYYRSHLVDDSPLAWDNAPACQQEQSSRKIPPLRGPPTSCVHECISTDRPYMTTSLSSLDFGDEAIICVGAFAYQAVKHRHAQYLSSDPLTFSRILSSCVTVSTPRQAQNISPASSSALSLLFIDRRFPFLLALLLPGMTDCGDAMELEGPSTM